MSEAGLLAYTWSGGEPLGQYVFFLALAAPGGLRVESLLALGTVEITLAAVPP